MPRMRSALLPLLSAVALAGCGDLKDSYGKEYVLYDSRRAESRNAGLTTEHPGTEAVATSTTIGPTAIGKDFARILLLEQVRAELARAIGAGLDGDGALARKQRAVDDELQARVTAAGEQLSAWRALRADELRQFVTR